MFQFSSCAFLTFLHYFLRHVPSRKKQVKVLRFFTTRCFWFQNVFIWVAVFINKWKIFEICFCFPLVQVFEGFSKAISENRKKYCVVTFLRGFILRHLYLNWIERHLSYFSSIFALFCAFMLVQKRFQSLRFYNNKFFVSKRFNSWFYLSKSFVDFFKRFLKTEKMCGYF